MKEVIKNIGGYIIRFIIVLIIVLCAFFAITLIPNKYIEKSVITSVDEGLESRYRVKIFNHIVTFDTYTDALMLSTAYSLDNSNPLESMLSCRSNYVPGFTDDISLDIYEGDNALNEKFNILDFEKLMRGNIVKSYEYARYWHGYLVILKPLMLVFSYNSIIIINYIINYILLGYLIYLMWKKGIKKGHIFAIIISFIAISGFIIFSCLEESITITIMLIATVYLLEKDTKNIGKYMMTVGMLTIFFEWLTTPILTYILPVLVYILLKKNENTKFKDIVKIVIKTGIAWCIGYLAMWATKWIIVDLLYNKGLINTAIKEALFRTDILSYNPITVIVDNLNYLGKVLSIYTVLIVVVNLIYTVYYKIKNKKIDEKLKYNLLFTALFFIPIIWQLVFSAHSFTHSYFVYRDLYISVLCAQLISVNLLEKTKRKKLAYIAYVILTICVIILNYIIV